MAIGATHPVCKEICDALGLKNVRRLEIRMAVDSVMTVEAVYFPEVEQVKALVPILERYQLIPADEEKG